MAYPNPNLIPIGAGGLSQAVSVSTTSAQSAVVASQTDPVYYNVWATVECFCRMGTNPIALSNGTDQFIPAELLFRVGPIPYGYRLAFKTATGTGTVYLTPEN